MPPEIHGGEEEAEDSRRGGRRYNNNNSIQQSSYSSLNSNASASPQSLSSSATHSVLALVGSIEEEEIKKVGEIKQWWKSFQPHDYYAIHSFFTPDETFDYIRMTISNIAKAQVTLLIGSGMMDLFRLFRHQEATMFLRLEFNTEMRMEESSLRFLDIRFNTSVPDICSQMKRAILALLDPIEFSLPNGFMKYELSNRNLLEELFNEVIDESAEEAKHVLLDLKTSLIPKIVEARKIPTLAKSSSSLSSYTNFITGCRTSKERIKSLLSYIQIFFSANIKRGIFWIQCIDLRHEMEKWCRRLLDDVLPNTIRKAFNTEMAAFLKSFNEFLSMQPVNSLEQTTETAARLEAVKNQMDQIKHHRQGILDLKDFLDSQLLDLRETEYRDFYKVLGAYGDIEKLWVKKNRVVITHSLFLIYKLTLISLYIYTSKFVILSFMSQLKNIEFR